MPTRRRANPQSPPPDVQPFTWEVDKVEELEMGFMSKEADGTNGVAGNERAFIVWVPEAHPHPYIHTVFGLVHRRLERQVMTYPALRGLFFSCIVLESF